MDSKGILGTPILGQLVNEFFKEKIATQWYKSALPKNNFNPAFLDTCNYTLKQGGCFCLSSAFQGMLKQSFFENEKLITQPSLTIWGNLDRSHRRTDKKV